MRDISFTPSPDVVVILNALLDTFESRAKRNIAAYEGEATYNASHPTEETTQVNKYTNKHTPRPIKISIADFPLPTYFSQTDPEPRVITNRQLQELAKNSLITLTWLPGETNHILHSVSLPNGTHTRQHELLYKLLNRIPINHHRNNLESIILSEKFRYQKDDWRGRVLNYILQQLRTGKSPSPFSLSDTNLDLDLLAVLQALPTLTTETPYRVFSVRVFNDSKRFEDLKLALVRLARRANPEWKLLASEALLRELNLVANPGYIHLAGNWELTDTNGQIIHLDSFTPSLGFPASQITSIQHITIRAESILCIENLTPFHEFTRANGRNPMQYATICLMGNPSPVIRHLLRLIPTEIPIHLWSDMDYGGFNILAQLRRQVGPRIQPYLMDMAVFEKYAHLARPLTQSDARNLKRILFNPILEDIHPVIKYILRRGLKLEQEAIQN